MHKSMARRVAAQRDAARHGSRFGRMADAIRDHDPDGSKARAVERHLADPNNPARPENNHNPLDVKPREVIVTEDVLSGRMEAHLVLSVERVWDNKVFLSLGNCDAHLLTLYTQLCTMTVEDNGINGILHIIPAGKWNGYQGVDRSVRIVNILLGSDPK